MAELPLPYLLLTQTVAIPGAERPVELWICLNLIDHRATAVGTSREDAMERMLATTKALGASLNGADANPGRKPANCEPPNSGWNVSGLGISSASESTS